MSNYYRLLRYTRLIFKSELHKDSISDLASLEEGQNAHNPNAVFFGYLPFSFVFNTMYSLLFSQHRGSIITTENYCHHPKISLNSSMNSNLYVRIDPNHSLPQVRKLSDQDLWIKSHRNKECRHTTLDRHQEYISNL